VKVRGHQLEVTWENYVHERFKDQKPSTDSRRRHLALAIFETVSGVQITNLRRITPQLAELYGKNSKDGESGPERFG
jgi:hypothetical protein